MWIARDEDDFPATGDPAGPLDLPRMERGLEEAREMLEDFRRKLASYQDQSPEHEQGRSTYTHLIAVLESVLAMGEGDLERAREVLPHLSS